LEHEHLHGSQNTVPERCPWPHRHGRRCWRRPHCRLRSATGNYDSVGAPDPNGKSARTALHPVPELQSVDSEEQQCLRLDNMHFLPNHVLLLLCHHATHGILRPAEPRSPLLRMANGGATKITSDSTVHEETCPIDNSRVV
jgi:hypothetical protein